MPELFIVSFCCLLVVGLGIWQTWSAYAKVRQILATPTSPVKELVESGKRQRLNVGKPGRQVEIKGIIRAQELLTAEMSHQPCVWYDTQTKMKIRRAEYRNGKRRVSTTTETLSRNTEFKRFWVEDATGRILVMPEGAEVEGVPAIRRNEPVGSDSEGLFSFLGIGEPREKIIANIYEEDILPPDQSVYVLGELSSGSGEPFIRRPLQASAEDRAFLISVKSEEEIIKKHRQRVYLSLALTLIALAGAIGSLYASMHR